MNARGICSVLVAGWLAVASAAFAQTSPDESAPLKEQLATQQAENEQLRRRIAALEEVLQTDVCKNPEAAKLLREASTSN